MNRISKTLLLIGGLLLFGAIYLYGFRNLNVLDSQIYNSRWDELFVLYIFDKLSSNLLNHPFALWDGGMFYPTANSLALNESMPLPALIYGCVLTIVQNKFLAYHITLLFLFALNVPAMFLLMRQFVGRAAAFLSGMIYGYAMIRFGQLGHVQLLAQWFYPLMAYYLVRYEREPRFRHATLAGLSLGLQFYCGIYLGMMLAALLLPYLLIQLYQRWDRKRFLFHILGLFLVAGVLVSPMAYKYLQISSHYGMTRSLEQATASSAHITNYFLEVAPGNIYDSLLARLRVRGTSSVEKRLFCGILLFILAFLGLKTFRNHTSTESRKLKLILIVSLVYVIWLSLGPNFFLYKIFYSYFPGFKGLRNPARFGLAYLFLMAGLAGAGAESILGKIRPASKKGLVTAALLAVILLENWAKVWFEPISDNLSGVTQFLSSTSEKWPLVHVPIQYEFNGGNEETVRLYYALSHGHPLVNGYSGFTPPAHKELLAMEDKEGPSARLLEKLRAMGVRHVVLDNGFPGEDIRKKWEAFLGDLRSQVLFKDSSNTLFYLP